MSMLMISWWPAKTLNNTPFGFECLKQHGIIVNLQKCKFGVPSLDFLGHLVDSSGIHPLPQAVTDFPQPTSRRQLRAFVGLVNFYRRFIPGCAQILQPLNTLLAGTQEWDKSLPWDDTTTTAFLGIKYSHSPCSPKARCADKCDDRRVRHCCGWSTAAVH